MKLFLDSSALVKRYIEEDGTVQVAGICRDATEIAVTIVCITEVLSACNRLVREENITIEQYDLIKNEFIGDIEEAIVLDLTKEVVGRSIECLERGALRSLDALHIGAALEYRCDLFVTSDNRQGQFADKMGLNVEIV